MGHMRVSPQVRVTSCPPPPFVHWLRGRCWMWVPATLHVCEIMPPQKDSGTNEKHPNVANVGKYTMHSTIHGVSGDAGCDLVSSRQPSFLADRSPIARESLANRSRRRPSVTGPSPMCSSFPFAKTGTRSDLLGNPVLPKHLTSKLSSLLLPCVLHYAVRYPCLPGSASADLVFPVSREKHLGPWRSRSCVFDRAAWTCPSTLRLKPEPNHRDW